MCDEQLEVFKEHYAKFHPKDFAEEDKLREKICEIVETKSKDEADKKKHLHKEESVTELIKNIKVCYGCYSRMCFERQRICKELNFPISYM